MYNPVSGKHGEEAAPAQTQSDTPGAGARVVPAPAPAHLSFQFPLWHVVSLDSKGIFLLKWFLIHKNKNHWLSPKVILKQRQFCVSKEFKQQSSLTCLEASLLPQTGAALCWDQRLGRVRLSQRIWCHARPRPGAAGEEIERKKCKLGYFWWVWAAQLTGPVSDGFTAFSPAPRYNYPVTMNILNWILGSACRRYHCK